MRDFSFLSEDTRLRRKPAASQQQGSAQNDSGGAPDAAAAAAAAAASAGANRMRIALPSFREVQAAERPAAPVNTFTPGLISRQSGQQRQQQQQQQPHQQQQQPPPGPPQAPLHNNNAAHNNNRGPGGSSIGAGAGSTWPPPAAAAAAAAAAAGPAGPSLGLNIQLPRYNQAAAAGAGAAARPTPLGAVRAAGSVLLPGAAGYNQQQQQQQQQQQPGAGGMAAGGTQSAPSQQQQAAAGQRSSAPAPPPVSNAVCVSQRQQGNPMLKHIKAVRWCWADIVPDYLCGANTAVLFLSLRYHLLSPDYILSRLAAVQRCYRLLVLLLLVDSQEVVKPLQELHRAALGADAVLVCGWSNEECARYIETFKAYENKPAASIMQRTDTDYLGRLSSALTSIRGINRSDAFMLASRFGSLADVINADGEDFAACPGLGPVKARRLLETFSQPFKKTLLSPVAGSAGAGGGAGEAGSSQQQQQQQQQQAQAHNAIPQQQQQQQQEVAHNLDPQQQQEEREEEPGEVYRSSADDGVDSDADVGGADSAEGAEGTEGDSEEEDGGGAYDDGQEAGEGDGAGAAAGDPAELLGGVVEEDYYVDDDLLLDDDEF